MFSTTLRQRPDLPSIIPLLASSTNPKVRETTLQTHDLALPISSPANDPTYQPFLIQTPTSLSNPDILERVTRFSTLTAHPAPTIAFVLSTTATKQETGNNTSAGDGLQAYMHLQILTHTLPHPPPVLPIPVLTHLLPLLQIYSTPFTPSPTPTPSGPTPSTITLNLLPHLTSSAPARTLSTHDANVLSDLCHSLDEVIEMAGSERVLGEWFGEREAKGMREFWEGEWIVE